MDSTTIDIAQAVLSTRIDMVYSECRRALKKLRELEHDVAAYESNPHYRNDEQLAQKHEKSAKTLLMELKSANDKLNDMREPKPVCVKVNGWFTDGRMCSRATIFVTYDDERFVELTFKDGRFKRATDDDKRQHFRYHESMKCKTDDRATKYVDMTVTDLADYGFIAGQPVFWDKTDWN